MAVDRDAPPMAAWIAIALGCTALVARPLTYGSIATTASVGLLGLLARPRDGDVARARWALVVVAGAGCFLLARVFGSPIGIRTTPYGLLSLAIVSVAEESFFRRYVYSWALRWGAAAAVMIAALTFGVVHVPLYGWRALPVDISAGILLGWQRWAAGTWTAPAITHLIADLLQVG